MIQQTLHTLPPGWTWARIGDIATLINGRAYSQPELLDRGTPVLRIQNLNGGNNWYYSDLELDDDKYCTKDDLLFAWSATFGPYWWTGPRAIYHYHIWKVVPKPMLHRRFAYYALQRVTNTVKSAAHGITMVHMTKAGMEDCMLPLPPLPEQRRIADILDKADAIRRKRKEAIALTEELLRSAFLEMFGDPVTNPKGWRTVPLDELIDQERGISYGVVQRGPHIEDGVPVVRISNFGDCRFDGRDVVRTSSEISDAYRRTILRGGELVVSIRGTVGRVAVVPVSAKGWNVSREVAVIPLLPGVSRPLVHRALLGNSLQRFMLGNVKGVAQSGINLKDLRLAPIPAPSADAIKEFESFVATNEALERRISASLLSSDELFDTLVTQAFLGELK
jgi:type I restriction enzyme S subunit